MQNGFDTVVLQQFAHEGLVAGITNDQFGVHDCRSKAGRQIVEHHDFGPACGELADDSVLGCEEYSHCN